MVLFSDDQIDRIVVRWRRYLFGGLMVMFLPLLLPRGWRIGLCSGFMLFSLGAYALWFRRWRFDPGLWMLAVFLTLLLGPCWAYFEFLNYHNLFARNPNQPAGPLSWDRFRFLLDTGLALFVFSRTVKLVASVAVKNWQRTRGLRHEQEDARANDV